MSKFTYWHRNIKLSNKKILWSGSDNQNFGNHYLKKVKQIIFHKTLMTWALIKTTL